jgi:hypothetical protein
MWGKKNKGGQFFWECKRVFFDKSKIQIKEKQMGLKTGTFTLKENKPMAVRHLIELLQKVPESQRDTSIRMFSDQEGNEINALWSVEIHDKGIVYLIPHHIRFDIEESIMKGKDK